MGIHYDWHVDGDTLFVTASGQDDGPEEVMAYAQAVIQLGIKHGVRRVLCDERNLQYRLGTLGIFDAAEYVAKIAPRIARAALVCAPGSAKDGRFWETVVVNRGLQVRVETDYDKALSWLKEE
jgi:hypothetical protein